MTISGECPRCGKQLVSRFQLRFCSRRCANAWINNQKCDSCGITLPHERSGLCVFCESFETEWPVERIYRRAAEVRAMRPEPVPLADDRPGNIRVIQGR